MNNSEIEILHNAGLQELQLGNFEQAVEDFGKELELQTQVYGDSADECGITYFYYGKALYNNALQQNQDLAQELEQNAEDLKSSIIQNYTRKIMQTGSYDKKVSSLKTMKDYVGQLQGLKQGISIEQGTSNIIGQSEHISQLSEQQGISKQKQIESNINELYKQDQSFEAEDSQEEEEGEDAEEEGDEEDNEDDMHLAWEMLEVSRLIFSRNEKLKYSQLSATHILLGDISLQKQDYHQAVEDYKRAGDLVQTYNSQNIRKLAEILFKLCLVQSMANQFQDALSSGEKVLKLLRAQLSSMHHGAEYIKCVDSNIKLEELWSKVGEVDCKEEVEDLIDMVLQIQEKMAEIDSSKTGKIVLEKGQVQQQNGQTQNCQLQLRLDGQQNEHNVKYDYHSTNGNENSQSNNLQQKQSATVGDGCKKSQGQLHENGKDQQQLEKQFNNINVLQNSSESALAIDELQQIKKQKLGQ